MKTLKLILSPGKHAKNAEYEARDILEKKYKYVVTANDKDDITQKGIELAHYGYRQEIRELARALARDINDRNLRSYDDVESWLFDTLSGHEFTIRTQDSQMVIMLSDHSETALEEGIVTVENGEIPWDSLAHYAMERDLVNYVENSLGFDLRAPKPNYAAGSDVTNEEGKHYSVCENCPIEKSEHVNFVITYGSAYTCHKCAGEYIVENPDNYEGVLGYINSHGTRSCFDCTVDDAGKIPADYKLIKEHTLYTCDYCDERYVSK